RLNARALAGVLALAFFVSACATRPPHWAQPPVNPGPGAPSGEYTVRAGDTLYSIAFRHGLDWRDVARWNGIEGPGYLIRVGRTPAWLGVCVCSVGGGSRGGRGGAGGWGGRAGVCGAGAGGGAAGGPGGGGPGGAPTPPARRRARPPPTPH